MNNDEYRVILLGALQFLEKEIEQLSNVMIVTLALHKALKETHPEVEKAYAKHYLAENTGPIKIGADGTRQALRQLIQRLSD